MMELQKRLAKSIEILTNREIEIKEIKLKKREGDDVFTIMGKENGRVSTFQLHGASLLYFDRSEKKVDEKIVHTFYVPSKKEEMKNAVSAK